MSKVGIFSRRNALAALIITLLFWGHPRQAAATPIFAQAYGMKCTACHSQVPFLNSFGRYIQRTGYSALSPAALKHAFPAFVMDARTGYSFQSNSVHAFTGPGNTAAGYAVGALGKDVTWHIEQWIRYNGSWGYLDTTWLAYNGFAHHTGHLFVGKLPAINLDENEAPFVLRDINDASLVPPIMVGVHDYSVDEAGARWGAKYNQYFGRFVAEFQYVGNPSASTSFNNAYNYVLENGSNRSFQWRTAYADPAHPWEAGVFGETGTLGWSGTASGTLLYRDNYTLVGPYVMKDPRPGSPGFRLQYAFTNDSNPGFLASGSAPPTLIGRANGSFMTGSVYQMLVHDRLTANLTYLHTNMPFAPIGQPGVYLSGLVQPNAPQTAGSAGLSYALTQYVHVFAAETSTARQKPYWSALFWLTPPLRERR